jgi:hypothetical protein
MKHTGLILPRFVLDSDLEGFAVVKVQSHAESANVTAGNWAARWVSLLLPSWQTSFCSPDKFSNSIISIWKLAYVYLFKYNEL